MSASATPRIFWPGADEGVSILVTSDHGNAEDLSVSDHTTNPVPVLLLTTDRAAARGVTSHVRALPDVYKSVLRYFEV